MSRNSPEVGDVWRDVDPRGGRTFLVVGFDTNKYGCPCAICRGGEDGSGRRTLVRLDRFRATLKRGYVFVRGAKA